MTKVRTANKFI